MEYWTSWILYHCRSWNLQRYFNRFEGCTSDNSFSITLAPIEELVADVTTTTPDCPGLNGNVFYNVSGGTGTIFYGWPTGTSTSNTNNLPQGNYNVVIQDQNGCAISSGFSIVDPSPVTAEIVNVNDVSCFGGIDGSVDFHFRWKSILWS